jgi:uncharacterized membrane protein
MEILLIVLGLLAAVVSVGLALLNAPVRVWLPIMLIAGVIGFLGGGGSGDGDAPWDYIRSR